MNMAELEVKIVGDVGLIMHNGQTADPLNRYAKEIKAISSVRKKTDEHYAEMARIEWAAGLYTTRDGRLILPCDMLNACLVEGAKKSKLGKQFKAGCFIQNDAELEIDNKYDKATDLWNYDCYRLVKAVRVGTSRVMRTRPIFHKWSAVICVQFNTQLVKEAEVLKAIEDAGVQVGIGDWRPIYGRFHIEA